VGQLTARRRPRYTRQRLSWRDKIHQAAERREQRRLGAALEFGEPVLQAAQIALFSDRIDCEGTDKPEDRKSTVPPPGHHATITFVSTIERPVRFRPNKHRSPPGRGGLLAGRRQLYSAALATRPVHDAFIRPPGGDIKVRSSARSVSPANSACLEIGRPRFSTCSRATNLRLVLEKALATHRFQYATSKDVCFVFSPASR